MKLLLSVLSEHVPPLVLPLVPLERPPPPRGIQCLFFLAEVLTLHPPVDQTSSLKNVFFSVDNDARRTSSPFHASLDDTHPHALVLHFSPELPPRPKSSPLTPSLSPPPQPHFQLLQPAHFPLLFSLCSPPLVAPTPLFTLPPARPYHSSDDLAFPSLTSNNSSYYCRG